MPKLSLQVDSGSEAADVTNIILRMKLLKTTPDWSLTADLLLAEEETQAITSFNINKSSSFGSPLP